VEVLVVLGIFLLAFWSLIYMAKRYFPKSFSIYPFLVMWKTTRFNNFIDRLGAKYRSLWKVLGTIGVAMSVGALFYISYILIQNLYLLLFNPESGSPVTPLIPGVTLSLTFNTMFFFGLSIAIILISHELAHGVSARAEGIGVKQTGLLLLAIIPGAFVEPDEESLKKARRSSQARVYAAGSGTNIVLALFVLIIMANASGVLSLSYDTTPSGVLISDIVGGSPADGILRNWDAIVSINGTLVNNTTGLTQALRSTTPNSTIPMELIRGGSSLSINFTLGTSSSQANTSYIGINTYNYLAPKNSFAPIWGPFYFAGSLNWLYLLSLNIGLINLFPVPSLDGDQLFRLFAEFILRNNKRAALLGNVIRWGALAILILSILLSFIIFPGFTFG
jgi:membrane-associated protease RseP (regulator of RpoE activity)